MEPNADFSALMSTVLSLVAELISRQANGDNAKEVCQHLRNAVVELGKAKQSVSRRSRRGRKKTKPVGIVPHTVAENQKGLLVLRCWNMFKDGIFAKKYPTNENDKEATNFMDLMNWLGHCIGEDFSDAEQLKRNALEQEGVIDHFQGDTTRVVKEINDMTQDREAKNYSRNKRKTQENS